MFDVGINLNEALKEAQDAGYAEADPSYDVDGLDTASKLVIMSNWIMEKRVSMADVTIEGISRVTTKEVGESKRLKKAVKLVGIINDSEISVHPRAVPVDHPLCVKGTLNSVVFKTDPAGEITITGRGAGGKETASAVIRDIIDVKNAIMM
jgi:homoserine dehydrogenase